MNGDPMSSDSRVAIDEAQCDNLGVYVSPISAWEIAALVAKKRLQLTLAPETWFETLLGQPGVVWYRCRRGFSSHRRFCPILLRGIRPTESSPLRRGNLVYRSLLATVI
jgi:PIN domain nuclease of toxin-antitoxin system